MENKQQKIKVCIVGAGAAGLCAARQLKARSHQFEFDIYEQTNMIGGTWNYTDEIGKDSKGLPIHSSMYQNLVTNIPIELMEFQDFPSSSKTSFVHHTEVLKYLHDYAKQSNIVDIIQLNHRIVNVSRNDHFWDVTIENIETNTTFKHQYDAILVCNGRYAKPFQPDIQGIHSFKGIVSHSHDYRIPNNFANQNVLILGAGPSGIDISLELSEFANSVILCHKQKQPYKQIPDNVKQEICTIKAISNDEIQLDNGNRYKNIDTIIFCTGYNYDFDFLDPNCGIHVNKNGRIQGVYLHLINFTHPSMAIWSIPKTILPFPLFHNQVLFFIKCLLKEVVLPSKQEMEHQVNEELKWRESIGIPEKYYHKMVKSEFMWEYDDKICKMAQIEPIKNIARKFYDHLNDLRKNNTATYKKMNFKIVSDDQFIVIN